MYYEDVVSGISTHILTRRMTNFKIAVDFSINISTHILTRRMTRDYLIYVSG